MTTTRTARRSLAIALALAVTGGLMAPPAARAAKPSDEQIFRAAVAAGLGYGFHKKIKDQDPNTVEGQLAIGLLKGARDGAVDGAVENLFPGLTFGQKATVRNLIIRSFDGNRQSKDKMIDLLKQAHPDLGGLIEIVDFIDRVNSLPR